MSDTRKHIAGIGPCGCMRIIMTLEDSARRPPFAPYKAGPQEMADFWKSIAESKVELKVQEFADESWKKIPWQCKVCTPAKQPRLF